MKTSDEEIEAYNRSMEFSAAMIVAMGGDPAKPTRDQAETVARMLIDLVFRADPDFLTTADKVLKDRRRISRAAKRKRH